MNNKNLFSIQILRAIAALAVSTVHFNAFYYMLKHQSNHAIITYSLASGVDLFFVISGFIMVYASQKLFGTPSRVNFLSRRLARIVPLYWATTALYIFLVVPHISPMHLLKSLLFIPYGRYEITPVYGIGWTLNFEMFFYMIFTAMIIFKREVSVLLIIIFLISLVTLNRYINLPLPFLFWGDAMVLEFIFGMLIALLYQWQVRLPFFITLPMLLIASLSLFFYTPHMPPSGYRYIEWGIPCAVIMASVVLTKRWPHFRYFKLPAALAILGDASYSLYLMHTIVISILFRLSYHIPHFSFKHALIYTIFGELITIPTAILTYRYFEKPMNKIILRLVQPKPKVLTQMV